jgi:hypothetical protein
MDKTSPGFKQKRFARYSEAYKFVDDIWGGLVDSDELREYLPRRGAGPTLESEESYRLRLQTTKLPRGFRDGIEKGVGKFGLVALDESTPPAIAGIENDVDGANSTLDFLVSGVIAALLRYGSCAVLVDTNDEQQLTLSIIPASSIQNVSQQGSVLARLTVASEEWVDDEYDAKQVMFYREYTGELLSIYESKDGELILTDEPTSLQDATGAARGEVYAVWFSCDPNMPDWEPPPPPFVGLAKDCVLQMLKVSELDRAESICNTQVLKRYHPEGFDPTKKQPPIPWDPEVVVEIPFGGDVKVDEPQGRAIAITHQRNNDRQAMMDQAVDAWLMEKVRTATESALADNAVRSRMEIISKVVEDGFSQVFRYLARLADRRIDLAESGGISLSGTAFNQVTDEEIKLATEDYMSGALSLGQIQEIKAQQWKSRGYDLPEGGPMMTLENTVIEG